MRPPPPMPPEGSTVSPTMIEEAGGKPWLYWLVLAGYLGLAVALCIVPQTFESGVSALQVFPVVLLAGLAYMGERSAAGKIVTGVYWLALMGLIAFLCVLLVFSCVVDAAFLRGEHVEPEDLFLPGGSKVLLFGIGAVGAAFLLSLLAWTKDARRFVAGMAELDENSFVHATAVATVATMTALFIVPPIVVGEPPILNMLRRNPQLDVGGGLQLVTGLMWFVPAAFLAVHVPGGRSLREGFERLGFTWPTRWHLAVAAVATAVLVWGMPILDNLIGQTWRQMGWPTTDEKEFLKLMKGAINPTGAILIGLAAGFGEELTIRGVLQPRVGLLLSNLLFAALHSWQYQWDGVLSVFIIGCILGVIRQRTNTTTAAIIHGGYDAVLVMQLYFALPAGS